MWLLGCAAWTAHGAAPIAARDGERIDRDGPIAFGLVGGLAGAGDDVLADLRAAELSFVVVADAVDRGAPARYAALQARLGSLPVQPLPGVGEARGDRRLRRFAQAWEGLGVRQLTEPVTWRAFDLQTEGHRWRVVLVDADQERLGAAFNDELFWVPKVVADGEVPVLILANQPVDSLAEVHQVSPGAARLHALIRSHLDPTRLVLYGAMGTATPELALPGGPWGEGWLGVGRVDRATGTLERVNERLVLDRGLDLALVDWFSTWSDVSDLDAGQDFRADRHPVAGWWKVVVDGDELRATLRMRGPTGWGDVHVARWSADTGWRSEHQGGESEVGAGPVGPGEDPQPVEPGLGQDPAPEEARGPGAPDRPDPVPEDLQDPAPEADPAQEDPQDPAPEADPAPRDQRDLGPDPLGTTSDDPRDPAPGARDLAPDEARPGPPEPAPNAPEVTPTGEAPPSGL